MKWVREGGIYLMKTSIENYLIQPFIRKGKIYSPAHPNVTSIWDTFLIATHSADSTVIL